MAETIGDAVQSTIENHPQVEQARARVSAAEEDRKSERSGYFPELAISGTGGVIDGNNSTSRASLVTRDSATSLLFEGNVSARQPLFDGFEVKNRVNAAQAGRDSESMNLLDVREQLAFRAAQAYLNVAQARTGLAMMNYHRKKLEDYLARIKVQVDQGSADDAEYHQARELIVMLDGFAADYEGQLRTAESQFFELAGRMPSTDMSPPVFDNSLIPVSVDAAVEEARAAHPAMQSAFFAARSAEFGIDAEKATLYPDVDGELSYLESDRDEDIGGEVTDARAVLRLNWNFETGGGQSARIRKKKQEHLQERARGEDIRRQVERDIRIAYAERDMIERKFENQIERFALNKKLFDTLEIQFDGGRARLLQLMQAEDQVFNAELEKLIMQYRLLGSQYAILVRMGRLQESLLQTAGNL